MSNYSTESHKKVSPRFRDWLTEMFHHRAILALWRNIQAVNLGTCWKSLFEGLCTSLIISKKLMNTLLVAILSGFKYVLYWIGTAVTPQSAWPG